MDGQTDVGHINLIGGLVTRNPSKKHNSVKVHLIISCSNPHIFLIREICFKHSVDSRNFKKWGRSPTTTQSVGEWLKILGDDFMIKFKPIKNTFSVYLDIFNSGLLLISGEFKASDRILKNSIRDARTPQPREIFSTP